MQSLHAKGNRDSGMAGDATGAHDIYMVESEVQTVRPALAASLQSRADLKRSYERDLYKRWSTTPTVYITCITRCVDGICR